MAYEIKDVLFFDTETTGVPDRKANWDTDFAEYPHIVQMAWILGTKVENHIIRPDGWEIPQETVEIHGVTTEYALEHGEPFAAVVDMFIQDCHEAGLICGHNVHFDTAMVKANILRELGREYYDGNGVETALYKGKRIDTMRPAMKWVDARMSNGRLKFPNLSELYSRCFPGESFPAHDALEDIKAVMRCLPVLLEMDLVKLEVKQYPEENAEKSEASSETPVNGPISAVKTEDGKLPVEGVKAPETGNSEELTESDGKTPEAAAPAIGPSSIENELLNQDNF